jgi:DNA-binding transcriptional ArsR family regulator
LETSTSLFYVPLHWIHALPPPKDSATALWTLGQMPPADRLPALALRHDTPLEIKEILLHVAARQAWGKQDEQALRAVYGRKGEAKYCYPSQDVPTILDCWANAESYGDRYLEALRAYQVSFFAEEENRIRPALQDALTRAQDLEERMPLPDLLEELTQGMRFSELSGLKELVLIPSYWCTPVSYIVKLDLQQEIWSFGARPVTASLEPGEIVPDEILRALRALADPTRQRILRYLAEQPLTQAQLARRLRLRAPTITHHLRELRMAGLVRLMMEGMAGKNKHYSARTEAIDHVLDALSKFLAGQD